MTKLLQAIPGRSRSAVGVYDLQHFGAYFGIADNPAGLDLPTDVLKSWMPTPLFQKVAGDQMMAFNRLCIHCLSLDAEQREKLTAKGWTSKQGSTLEVGATLYRNKKTGEIRAFVEPQVVSLATISSRSTDLQRPPIDLITGEKMEKWWEEWHEYGRWHSHNTMTAYPSSIDDDSELQTPGIYAIFGNYRPDDQFVGGHSFRVYSSVVTPSVKAGENCRRTHFAEIVDGVIKIRDLTWRDIMLWGEDDTVTFHPDVLQNVMVREPEDWKPAQTTIYPSDTKQLWPSRTWDEDWERFLPEHYRPKKDDEFEGLDTGYGSGRETGKGSRKQRRAARKKVMSPYTVWQERVEKVADSFGFAYSRDRDTMWRVVSILSNLEEVAEVSRGDDWLFGVLNQLVMEHFEMTVLTLDEALDLSETGNLPSVHEHMNNLEEDIAQADPTELDD